MSQNRFSHNAAKISALNVYILPLTLVGCALLLYFPSVLTPYWGDDYVFLQQARVSRLNAESWWLSFYSPSELVFWRPLSMDTYFRWVETYLGADVIYAHLANLFLWILASACVGIFAWSFAGVMKWRLRIWVAVTVAGVYAINGAHFLPVHWIAAVNSSILVVWTSLVLAAWVLAPQLRFHARVIICIVMPVLQLLALLSKESAILIPFLMLALTAFCWGELKASYLEIVAWVACVCVCCVWFYFYRQFSGPHPGAYSLKIGTNIIRNFLSLVSWILNVPREALRMILTDNKLLGIAWVVLVAVPMLGFIFLSCANLKLRLTQWLGLLLFIGIAYAPYFVLAEQSYEYYAATSLIFPAVIVAYGVLISQRRLLAGGLLVMSSTLAVEGSRHLAYPSLIGRANWGELQLQQLELQRPVPSPLVVNIQNPHRFYAIGVAGLSWRLGIPMSEIYVSHQCPRNAEKILAEDAATGNLFWRSCDSIANSTP